MGQVGGGEGGGEREKLGRDRLTKVCRNKI